MVSPANEDRSTKRPGGVFDIKAMRAELLGLGSAKARATKLKELAELAKQTLEFSDSPDEDFLVVIAYRALDLILLPNNDIENDKDAVVRAYADVNEAKEAVKAKMAETIAETTSLEAMLASGEVSIFSIPVQFNDFGGTPRTSLGDLGVQEFNQVLTALMLNFFDRKTAVEGKREAMDLPPTVGQMIVSLGGTSGTKGTIRDFMRGLRGADSLHADPRKIDLVRELEAIYRLLVQKGQETGSDELSAIAQEAVRGQNIPLSDSEI